MQPHEYSVIGHSRSTIGRYLGVAAGLLASLTAVIVTVTLDLAKRWGLSDGTANVILFPINATTFYLIGHLAFEKWVWRRRIIQSLLGIPDLNGQWECLGETKDQDGNVTHYWNGTVTITQTWEKIRVYLNTGQSSSRSKSASLVKEPGRGYVLMYSYQNDPRIGEPELRSHVGYCELQLSENLTSAEGAYFNNRGRVTFGRMTLTRKENGNG